MEEDEYYEMVHVNISASQHLLNEFPTGYNATTGSVVSAGFTLLFILVALLGNFTVCWLFVVNRKIRVRGYYYIFSLAVSDILIAVFSMPPMVSYQLTRLHFLDHDVCLYVLSFIDVIDIISSISSVTNLTAISLDRLFGALMPLKHRLVMTRKRILLTIGFAWVYSIGLALMKLIPHFYHYIVFVFTLGFAMPLLIIIISYTLIFIIAMKKTKRMNTVNKENVMVRTVLVVVVVFCVCWAPFFIVSILYQYCISCGFIYEESFETVVLIIKLLTYSNSCCNPFIYGYLNIDFRNAFRAIRRRRKLSSNTSSFSTNTNGRDYDKRFGTSRYVVRQTLLVDDQIEVVLPKFSTVSEVDIRNDRVESLKRSLSLRSESLKRSLSLRSDCSCYKDKSIEDQDDWEINTDTFLYHLTDLEETII